MLTPLGEVPLITINVGNLQLALIESQLMYLLVAAIVGLVAEFIVGWRLPIGIMGAIIAALVGIWIVTNGVILIIPVIPSCSACHSSRRCLELPFSQRFGTC